MLAASVPPAVQGIFSAWSSAVPSGQVWVCVVGSFYCAFTSELVLTYLERINSSCTAVSFFLLFFLQIFNQFQGCCHQLVMAVINCALGRMDNKASLASAAFYLHFGVNSALQMSSKL